jgi:hypothetical protein
LCRAEASWNELYLTKYVKPNPVFPTLLFYEVGEIFRSSNLIPAAQLAQTFFYREYLHPKGWEKSSAPYLRNAQRVAQLLPSS